MGLFDSLLEALTVNLFQNEQTVNCVQNVRPNFIITLNQCTMHRPWAFLFHPRWHWHVTPRGDLTQSPWPHPPGSPQANEPREGSFSGIIRGDMGTARLLSFERLLLLGRLICLNLRLG